MHIVANRSIAFFLQFVVVVVISSGKLCTWTTHAGNFSTPILCDVLTLSLSLSFSLAGNKKREYCNIVDATIHKMLQQQQQKAFQTQFHIT